MSKQLKARDILNALYDFAFQESDGDKPKTHEAIRSELQSLGICTDSLWEQIQKDLQQANRPRSPTKRTDP